jgi:hypothetical protein
LLGKLTGILPGELERAEDTQVMRLVENNIETLMVYTESDTVAVDIPEDISKTELSLKEHFKIVETNETA